MANNFIPAKDVDFNEWQNNLFNYASAKYAEWNVPEAQWRAITALQADFNDKYALAESPETRTPVAILAKTEARRALVTSLRAFLKAFISYNPAVSDADKRAMGLHVSDSKPSRVDVPSSPVETEIDSSVIRRLKLNFRDSGSASKAKPRGVHAAEIRWAILDSPPVSISDLVNSDVDTHTPFTLEFDENQRGKTVYFCLRWENTRGEKGPWGEIVSAIVP